MQNLQFIPLSIEEYGDAVESLFYLNLCQGKKAKFVKARIDKMK